MRTHLAPRTWTLKCPQIACMSLTRPPWQLSSARVHHDSCMHTVVSWAVHRHVRSPFVHAFPWLWTGCRKAAKAQHRRQRRQRRPRWQRRRCQRPRARAMFAPSRVCHCCRSRAVSIASPSTCHWRHAARCVALQRAAGAADLAHMRRRRAALLAPSGAPASCQIVCSSACLKACTMLRCACRCLHASISAAYGNLPCAHARSL